MEKDGRVKECVKKRGGTLQASGDFLWTCAGVIVAGHCLLPSIMSFFSSSTPSSVTAVASTSGDKDIEVSEPPSDSISSLSFSSQADYLAVGSWDNSVCPALLHAPGGGH